MVDLNGYDYVDFGCSSAGAAEFMQKRFSAEGGICVDADERRIAAATRDEAKAERTDIADRASFDGKVRFAMIANLLERQPDLATVARIVDAALHVSRSFLFIRMPWFNSDDALLRHGLKLAWSNTSAALVRPTSLDLHRILQPYLEKGAISRFAIFGHRRIEDAANERVLPLNAPRGAHRYDEAAHGTKPVVTFDPPVYVEQVAIVARRTPQVIESVGKKFFTLEPIFDTQGAEPAVVPVVAPAPPAIRPPTPAPGSRPLGSPRPPRSRSRLLGDRG